MLCEEEAVEKSMEKGETDRVAGGDRQDHLDAAVEDSGPEREVQLRREGGEGAAGAAGGEEGEGGTD
ncbi:uncharacterized protein MONOS_14963 [Monocercomonoides exilis]|uniref:uncharacterized protein n=1 Tax=Monocercomonoides exilis TaxID=2049356 RepID=UPI003559945D|nr:hypothetical protein MONOS_14963 [Monocercomonoides exilis]|eukprot:MONOS_14963.1-p1 / transcript=MONOS_14963.1 / gene=MONOS_14963 / organism=Monocercomonoides_exilis_PA203 / gene_product=unspecified product / transcript_product=unspecified product / location=Mono_scaffold01116:3970-4335(-) / protein_length=67 / sequence_SO=supercontig / SO=protein_coding / is_pseudo=false